MASITLGGNPVETSGKLPEIGSKLADFKLVTTDLETKTLSDFEGNNLIFNIFPSVNTGICSASVRAFNTSASDFKDTKVLCISRDLPFAQKNFCAAENIDNVVMLSDFKTGAFGMDYGLTIVGSPFDALLSRCIIVADKNHNVIYTEQVPEIAQEPNYHEAYKALNVLK